LNSRSSVDGVAAVALIGVLHPEVCEPGTSCLAKLNSKASGRRLRSFSCQRTTLRGFRVAPNVVVDSSLVDCRWAAGGGCWRACSISGAILCRIVVYGNVAAVSSARISTITSTSISTMDTASIELRGWRRCIAAVAPRSSVNDQSGRVGNILLN